MTDEKPTPLARLSNRGRALVQSPPMPAYVSEHFTRAAEPWDPESRPRGYISLCIAENKLNASGLIEQLSTYPVPERVLGYDVMSGNLEFRTRLAAFMGRSFLGRQFDPEQLVVLAGAGAVLEMLFYALCDSGDGVLIPTPSYAGFWPDLETRDEIRVVPVDCLSSEDFRLTPERLDLAFEAAGCEVRALLFTTPNNPLACVYSETQLREIVAWCRGRGIHLIVDEIYALSVFGESSFRSVASLAPELGADIHVVWAFSKDFGASGLRCGVLVSENEAVLEAVGGLAYWAACSGHTQHILSELVADEAAVDKQLANSRRKLGAAHTALTQSLDSAGIRHLPAEAAFFVICDLREYLEAPTWEAERALWRRILDQANVNLTPGEACRIHEPGFFRLCYAAESQAAVVEAITRLAGILAAT